MNTNDKIIWHIEKWFETHTVMTKDHYDMLKEMAQYKEEHTAKDKKRLKLTKEELFEDIEIETEGLVPVKWRNKGSPNWKEYIYPEEKK